jgi:hypothetical protein
LVRNTNRGWKIRDASAVSPSNVGIGHIVTALRHALADTLNTTFGIVQADVN